MLVQLIIKNSTSQEFRSKEINQTRNYFIEEIKQNKLISRKHKKFCKILNYTGCVSISGLLSLVGIQVGIASFSIIISISAVITTGIKKTKSIIKEMKKKLDKIVLLANTKFNTTKFLISKVLIDLVICHDEFALVNNVLKKYNGIKEEIKNSSNK